MRTFIDIRFYVDPATGLDADDVAAMIADQKVDLDVVKIKSHKTLGFGAESDDLGVVRWDELVREDGYDR